MNNIAPKLMPPDEKLGVNSKKYMGSSFMMKSKISNKERPTGTF